jgi:organic hydroperoxide reductase OsmC/OhrA
MNKEQTYKVVVEWTGNKGQGTTDYRSYERSHVFKAKGKPDLPGSADPMFQGDASRWNPEELILASLSACHMLWYLHLCSVKKIIVQEYSDQPTAKMVIEPSGDGKISEATLQPKIRITDSSRIEEAKSLHEEAHKKCFIARSINFPVHLAPSVDAQ